MQITYENITITPYKIQHLEQLTITHQLGEHSHMLLTAMLEQQVAEDLVMGSGIEESISVYANNLPQPLVFCGIVADVKIHHEGGVYYLSIEAFSSTILMDVQKRTRSFQDKTAKYRDIFSILMGDYAGGAFIDTATNNNQTGKFLMQYEETDWQFLKRLASHFKASIIPHAQSAQPKCFIGLPDKAMVGRLDSYEYTVVKNNLRYQKSKYNGTKLMQQDANSYTIQTADLLKLGDLVQYQELSLYINQVRTEISAAVVENHYQLSTANGCSQMTQYHERITGLALEGRVLQTATDQIKLHLTIDPSQDVGTAHYFTYSTLYTAGNNTGFYCMPEKNDVIFVYFPTDKEWEGFALQGIRKQSHPDNKLSDPEIKYLRTKYGKELKFSPDEILITSTDDESFIRLNDHTGIEVYCTNPIKIKTSNNLQVESGKNIEMVAREQIHLTCKSSEITMDGSVSIVGYEVRQN